MKFFLVFVKNRKKFDKYVKINKIRNKTIIDIQRLIDDENIDLLNKKDLDYLKVLIYKMITLAQEKGKSVYYVPWIKKDFEIDKIFSLKKLPQIEHFNALVFYKDFSQDNKFIDLLLNNTHEFTNMQILEDY
jgi:hypothetical protein